MPELVIDGKSRNIHCEPCWICGRSAIIMLDADEVEGYLKWAARDEKVQVAFPRWPKDKCELLLTGTHAQCWEQMAGPEPDDEE
jgi:hypothetical protein